MTEMQFPASRLQTNLFRQYRANPQSTDLNLAFGFLADHLSVPRLERALNQIIARHENLRSNFIEESGANTTVTAENTHIAQSAQALTIWQKIAPSRTLHIEQFTSDNLRDFIRPFRLESDLLIRAAVKDDTVLLDFSHIITDGFSMAIFFRELDTFYSGGEPSNQPPAAQDCLVPDQIFSANEPYWLSQLETPGARTFLPADFARTQTYGGSGASKVAWLGKKLTKAVQDKCRRLKITPFVLYLTAWCLFLAKATKSDDVLTGTNFSCRTKGNLRSIGFYATVVPVRISIPTLPRTAEQTDTLLLNVHAHVREMLRHQQADMDSVLEKKGLRDLRDVFSTLFSFEHEKMADIRLDGKKCEFVPIPTKDSGFDCNICCFPFRDEAALLLIYRKDLFTAKTARGFLTAFTDAITSLTN